MMGPNLDSPHEERVLRRFHSQADIPPRNAGGSEKGRYLRADRKLSLPVGRKSESVLFLVDFEIQDDVLAAIEAGDRTSL